MFKVLLVDADGQVLDPVGFPNRGAELDGRRDVSHGAWPEVPQHCTVEPA
jgi:hypothetical protein